MGTIQEIGLFYKFCLRILCHICIKYRILFIDKLKSGKSHKFQLAKYKTDIKYTQTKHETFPTMSHCIKCLQMRYITGFALCRDRKKWEISKIPFAPTNNPAERPCRVVYVNRFLLAPPVSLCPFIVHRRQIGEIGK